MQEWVEKGILQNIHNLLKSRKVVSFSFFFFFSCGLEPWLDICGVKPCEKFT